MWNIQYIRGRLVKGEHPIDDLHFLLLEYVTIDHLRVAPAEIVYEKLPLIAKNQLVLDKKMKPNPMA
jgi:hypothetical protein